MLSSPPEPGTDKGWVLMILHGSKGHMGFCRPGDEKWTVIECKRKCAYQSLEYYRGKFYILDYGGEVWECDVIGKSNDNRPVCLKKLNVNICKKIRCRQAYLVESAGSLLVVIRYGVQDGNVSFKFSVFEIDIERGGYKKVSLRSRSIFLGHSATLSVDTFWYPELIPNSIYFTDDCYEFYRHQPQGEGGGTNMGVYSMEDKSVKPHYSGKSLSFVCPPVWTFLTSRY